MSPSNSHTVYSTNGKLHAVVVQDLLQQAGVPAALTPSRDGYYLDVRVPSEWLFQAANLLSVDHNNCEACSAPSNSKGFAQEWK